MLLRSICVGCPNDGAGCVGPDWAEQLCAYTDGEFTDWTPGTTGPFEWNDMAFFRGRYSWYSADFLLGDATLYIMNDFFSNTQGIDPTDYNLFRVWLPGMTQTDAYEIRVYGDNTVQAWQNGSPVAVTGAYQYTTSPFSQSSEHSVYEIEIPIDTSMLNRPVSMIAKDPDYPAGPQEGAFVGTMTPLSTGGVEVQRVTTPISFSVDGGQNNPLRNGVSGPAANPAEGIHPNTSSPNDVFSLGSAGGHGLATEGEIFQASGQFGKVPDMTNADRMSGALGVGPGPHAPPPAGAPTQTVPGAFGLAANDNVNAMSYGKDAGDFLHFSVDPDAVGQVGTDVNFEAVVSPIPVIPASFSPSMPANDNGGDPGEEAAGDIFISQRFSDFGAWGYRRFMPAYGQSKLNSLEVDEVFLGLQASAATGTILGAPEDDLDALEMSDTGDAAWGVDVNGDGLVDADVTRNAFFSLDPWSPTITGSGGALDACDILVSRDASRSFFVFADGVTDIDLLAEDDLDALILSDIVTPGELDLGLDEALFSLAPGSASVALLGISPGDVFYTDFNRAFNPFLHWKLGGSMYATAESLGLLVTDNLNALDISVPEPATLSLLAVCGLGLLKRRRS